MKPRTVVGLQMEMESSRREEFLKRKLESLKGKLESLKKMSSRLEALSQKQWISQFPDIGKFFEIEKRDDLIQRWLEWKKERRSREFAFLSSSRASYEDLSKRAILHILENPSSFTPPSLSDSDYAACEVLAFGIGARVLQGEHKFFKVFADQLLIAKNTAQDVKNGHLKPEEVISNGVIAIRLNTLRKSDVRMRAVLIEFDKFVRSHHCIPSKSDLRKATAGATNAKSTKSIVWVNTWKRLGLDWLPD